MGRRFLRRRGLYDHVLPEQEESLPTSSSVGAPKRTRRGCPRATPPHSDGDARDGEDRWSQRVRNLSVENGGVRGDASGHRASLAIPGSGQARSSQRRDSTGARWIPHRTIESAKATTSESPPCGPCGSHDLRAGCRPRRKSVGRRLPRWRGMLRHVSFASTEGWFGLATCSRVGQSAWRGGRPARCAGTAATGIPRPWANRKTWRSR